MNTMKHTETEVKRMKNLSLLLSVAVLCLTGCANQTESKTISTPQSLQSLSISSNTETGTSLSSTGTNIETEQETTIQDSATSQTFSTQQEFVEYMYQKVTALEDTLSLLDSNLTQVTSVAGTDDEAGQLSIRNNLLQQTSDEMEKIEALILPNDEVTNLHDYVVKAYDYNILYKTAESQIVKAENLEDRQLLLDANAENERLGQNYLTLAWEEIDRLSTTTYYRK